jgi:hypothetical protein
MSFHFTRQFLLLFGLGLPPFFLQAQTSIDVKSAIEQAMAQYRYSLGLHKDSAGIPRSFVNGKVTYVPTDDWVSGFYAGSLWYLVELAGWNKLKDQGKKLETAAMKYTLALEKEQFNVAHHDVGFMMYCSYGNALRLRNKKEFEPILLQTARSLCKRFNPKTGVIRSWGPIGDTSAYRTIIDNMMNLELLFRATEISGDPSFRQIAIQHANTTLKNHFRPDGSSYHVLHYDPETGAVLRKRTHQGFNDESAWARGQSWGLYGFTMCYRFTEDPAYLAQAQKIAKFLMDHPNLPKDKIPYWDYNAPGIPNEPRDASAAALMASALLELSQYAPKESATYRSFARDILRSLTSPAYTAKTGTNGGFILEHSTGFKLGNSEIDVPLNYADYYHLEALKRWQDLKK